MPAILVTEATIFHLITCSVYSDRFLAISQLRVNVGQFLIVYRVLLCKT